MIQSGKLNIIIDGQFGSTGKGLLSSYVGTMYDVDLSITNASPNAGHTFYLGDVPHVTHHLPVTGVMNPDSIIYLCPGAIINPSILLEEMETHNVSPDRVYIHPRAAVIETEDIEAEQEGSVKKIASTRSGVGSALVRKINRSAQLAGENKALRSMARELNVKWYLDADVTAVMEVPQGFDLSINSGLSYPHCTSREITIPAAMADAQVHPEYLGSVIVCIRTFPIRVGHIVEDGKIVGNSGPFYNDSCETTWEELGVTPERTTCTRRVRRVATFSMMQYKRMLRAFEPDYILLNFANYLSKRELSDLIDKLPEVTHISYGPRVEDVECINNTTIGMYGPNAMASARFRLWENE